MSAYESLSHAKWDCKYPIVFVPKGRKKTLYGKVRKFLGPVFHELAGQRRSEILEGYMVQDHVHMLCKSQRSWPRLRRVGRRRIVPCCYSPRLDDQSPF